MPRVRRLSQRTQRSTVTSFPAFTSNWDCFSMTHLWWLFSQSMLRLEIFLDRFLNGNILDITHRNSRHRFDISAALARCWT